MSGLAKPGKQGGTAEIPFVPELTKGFLFILRRHPGRKELQMKTSRILPMYATRITVVLRPLLVGLCDLASARLDRQNNAMQSALNHGRYRHD
jgi:hypothetical protein